MPREKFGTLTEQMFYILLCLLEERCGVDIMALLDEMTGGRVKVGPGTLYNLLEEFTRAEMIRETRSVGRKRSYIITDHGREILRREQERLTRMMSDYDRFTKGEDK